MVLLNQVLNVLHSFVVPHHQNSNVFFDLITWPNTGYKNPIDKHLGNAVFRFKIEYVTEHYMFVHLVTLTLDLTICSLNVSLIQIEYLYPFTPFFNNVLICKYKLRIESLFLLSNVYVDVIDSKPIESVTFCKRVERGRWLLTAHYINDPLEIHFFELQHLPDFSYSTETRLNNWEILFPCLLLISKILRSLVFHCNQLVFLFSYPYIVWLKIVKLEYIESSQGQLF